MYNIGDIVKAINDKPLGNNKISPEVIIGQEYHILNIVLDKEGNQHLDIGLPSEYNYIRSFETDEELPKGDLIHWCHPSRFEKVI